MGHKVHPTGFRIGVIRDWQAKWYADKHYSEFLHEDLKIRHAIQSWNKEASISLIEIDRQANKVAVTIHTARPGILIGRGGQRVDEMRLRLDKLIGKRIQINIQEIRQPELDAYLVAKAIAEQIERRIAYRRAMKQSLLRTIQAGAKGIRISCAGRLGGAEIARRQTIHQGQVPLHTLRADIDYGFTEAHTTMGRIGVKVWIYKGDILPEPKTMEIEELLTEVVTDTSPEIVSTVEPEKKPRTRSKKAALPATVEPEEKHIEPAIDMSSEAEPSTPMEEEEQEVVTDTSPEIVSTVEPEKKPRTRSKKAALPATVEPEEKHIEPAIDMSSETEPSTPMEEEEQEVVTDTSPEIVSTVEPEKKPRTRSKKAALPATVEPEEKHIEPAIDMSSEAEPSTPMEEEEKDVTT